LWLDLSEFNILSLSGGRYPGVFVLVILQFLVGSIHAVIGLGLVFTTSGELGYNIYTFLYGVLNIIFAYGVWSGKKSGWLGTIIMSLFVIVVDICAVLNITLILGVPKTAALGEIVYSLVVVAYLFQPKIIKLFKKVN
jgi:hypothetical protein